MENNKTKQAFWTAYAMFFAMSGAERVRKLRERRREEEKRALVEHIVAVMRRAEHAKFNAGAIGPCRDALLQLPLAQVKEIAEAYKTHDRTGRNRLEAHTGGTDIERVSEMADTDNDQET